MKIFRSAGLVLAAALMAVLALVVPGSAVSSSTPQPLSDCFGHSGVQFSNKDAYVCETKLGNDPSGALYWMVTLDNGVNGSLGDGVNVDWYKLHPAPGNFWVFETMLPGDNLRNDGRSVIIDTNPFGYCQVIFPSWTQTPTDCQDFTQGGQPGEIHGMTPQEQSSVNEFMKVMRAEIPLANR